MTATPTEAKYPDANWQRVKLPDGRRALIAATFHNGKRVVVVKPLQPKRSPNG